MLPTTKVAAALVALLSLTGVGSALAQQTPVHFTMKPLQGVSFKVDGKNAVSYFQREQGTCKLVLTVASAPDWNHLKSFDASRFEASVPALKATHYRSNEGEVLKFECMADAKAMSVSKVKRLADRSGGVQ